MQCNKDHQEREMPNTPKTYRDLPPPEKRQKTTKKLQVRGLILGVQAEGDERVEDVVRGREKETLGETQTVSVCVVAKPLGSLIFSTKISRSDHLTPISFSERHFLASMVPHA